MNIRAARCLDLLAALTACWVLAGQSSAFALTADQCWGQWHGPANGSARLPQGPGTNLVHTWALDLHATGMDGGDSWQNNKTLRADEKAFYLKSDRWYQGDLPIYKLDAATGTQLWSVAGSTWEDSKSHRLFQLFDAPQGFRAIHRGTFYGQGWNTIDVQSHATSLLDPLDGHSILGGRILMGKWAWVNTFPYFSSSSPAYWHGGLLERWNGSAYVTADTEPFALMDHAWDGDHCVVFGLFGYHGDYSPFDQGRYWVLDAQGNKVEDVALSNIYLPSCPNWDTFPESDIVTKLAIKGHYIYAVERTTATTARLVRRDLDHALAESGAIAVSNQVVSYCFDDQALYLQVHSQVVAYSLDLGTQLWSAATPERSDLYSPYLLYDQGFFNNMKLDQTIACDGTYLYDTTDDRLQVRRAADGAVQFEHVFADLNTMTDTAIAGNICLTTNCVLVASAVDFTRLWAFGPQATGPLAIATASPMARVGFVGTAYNQSFDAVNGTGPLAWTVLSGSLPAGLTLSAAGVVSGTPTTVGTSNFTVQVTDNASNTATKAMALAVNATLTITNPSPLPAGFVGIPYSCTITTAGGIPPASIIGWTAPLPTGLHISSGVISGTPTTNGTWSFGLIVYDSVGTHATNYLAMTIVSNLAVAFNATSSWGSELITNVSLPVSLNAAPTTTVAVGYAVTGGTATGGGVDYTLASGTLTFTAGQTNKNIVLAVVDDAIAESSETIMVTLSNPTNAALGANASYTYTILDNDWPINVGFKATASSGPESATTVNLPVSLSAASTNQTITVDYAVTGGTGTGGGVDYTLNSGTLTFNPGETNQNIAFTVMDDTLSEDDETVVVTLSTPVNVNLGTNVTHTYTILDNDAAPTVAFDLAASNSLESVTTVIIPVSLSAASGRPVTVNYGVTGGTAQNSSDYTLIGSGLLTFNPGDTTTSITLHVVNDMTYEPDETVIVSLSSPLNAGLGNNTNYTYTIINDDFTLPTVGFGLAAVRGVETMATVSIPVSLNGASAGPVTVDYAATGGTATGGGVDYSLPPGTLTFDPGATTTNITLTVVNDSLAETDETVIVTLSNPTNATLGTNTTYTYTIVDDDAGALQFGAPAYSVNESGGSATVTVSRAGGSNGVASVHYATSNGTATAGSDYTAATGTLTWADGDMSDKTFAVTILDDTNYEGNETVALWLSGPTGVASLGVQNAAVLTIVDNEAQSPGSVQFVAPAYSVNENDGSATITVSRTSGSTGAVSVSYATGDGTATDGSDYTAATGTLSWADGDATNKTFTVTIADQGLYVGSKTVNLALSGPTGGASLGPASNAVLTIVENDPPPGGSLQFSAATYRVTESGGSATITVTRVSGSTGAVSVSYATSNGTAIAGSNYMATNGTVAWADGDLTNKTFTVPIIDDAFYGGNQTVNLRLGGPAGGASLGAPSNAVLTIVETDPIPPGSLQFSAATYNVNESGGSATITVTRAAGSAGAISVNYATSDGTATAGSDYTAATGTLAWADGDTTNKTFTVPIIDDALAESNETVSLVLSGPSGGATLGAPSNAVLTIVDDDSPAVANHTIYVDVNASGANNGTSWADAYTNIQAGINDINFTSNPPNTVMVAGGTYNEQLLLTSAQSGTATGTNLIVAKTGELPIIDGANTRSYAFCVSNTAFLTIQGFDIRRTTVGADGYSAAILAQGYPSSAIGAANYSTNITFRQCLIHDNAGSGAKPAEAYAYAKSWVFDQCLFYNNGTAGTKATGGIVFSKNSQTSLLVRHCTIYGNLLYGIYVPDYVQAGLTAKDNIIVNNGAYGVSVDSTSVGAVVVTNNDVFGNGLNYNFTSSSLNGSLSNNPSFADPRSLDFRLFADSPCLHKGTDGKDLGAYSDGPHVALPGMKTYYVRNDGNDGNSGTVNSAGGAFATIQHAADLATPGDTVLVQAGTYNEQVALTRSGSASNAITFLANGTVNITNSTGHGILLDRTTRVLANGFAIHNARTNGVHFYRSFDNGVANCNVYSNGVSGVVFQLSDANVVLTSRIHDNTDKGVSLTAQSGGNTIDRCTIDHNRGTGADKGFGIGVTGGTAEYIYNLTVRQCLLFNNNCGIDFPYSYKGDGWLVENCDIYSNTTQGVYLGQYNGALTIRNSIVVRNATGLNNGGSTLASDHNDVWSNATDYTSVTAGAGSVSTDPLFKNAASGNFQLNNGSPCVDAGTNRAWMTGATDLAGNPRIARGASSLTVDMGAYERQGIGAFTLLQIR